MPLIDLYNGTPQGMANSTPMLSPKLQKEILPYGGGSFTPGGGSAIAPAPIFTGVKPVQAVVPKVPQRNFYKNGSSYYYADTNQKILTPSELQVAAKSGVEVATPNAGANSAASSGINYDKYKDPKTGEIMSPQEYAIYLGNKIPKGNGEITNYAGDALANPNETAAQLATRATNLNNSRNDIATGATDPYGVGNQSGIAYSPTELKAIENAYAGVYDPALQDVFARLKAKEDADKNDLAQKNKMTEMALQHQYDMELKQTLSGSDRVSTANGAGGYGGGSGGGYVELKQTLSGSDRVSTANGAGGYGGGSGGGYVEGADPVVDSWVQRISRGESTLADIKGVANQGLRNMVTMGLNTSKARNATSNGNLDALNIANQLLLNPSLENISGFMDQKLGGLFGQAKTAKTNFDQLSGILQLAKASSFKGQGQVSNFEREILNSAASSLNRGLSDSEFKKQLIKTRGVFANLSGLSTPVKITDPSSGESDVQNLSTDEINKFIMDGAIIEYVQ